MAARNIRTVPSTLAEPATAVDWTADWARQQMVVASEGASAILRGFQAMRTIQEQAAQQAAARHATVADRMRKAADSGEVLALQAQLLRSDLESATQTWQQLAGAAMEMNTELIGCTTHLVGTEDFFGPTAARFLHS